ncbi:ATP-binding protein [Hymenobacter aerilatus]|uniref:ATP-binding protein n=1 Tax=Hymenobacter aerilatus TaxID=2932251 RepID=A0A8T9STG6_9BACT|nr:ATP-binding protein [Hymenobacter aerilatus]UOR05442.1 ATP-binding protein [Hymenobacter aerilatus]
MKKDIRISCNRENLKVVRDFVNDYLATHNLSDLQLNQIVLAVDEVVANLIIHANGEDESRSLCLSINFVNHAVDIAIEDSSPVSYRPATFREPDLNEHVRLGKKGGVGMALVNRIMDSVEFTTSGAHNVCRLHKRVS